MDKQKEANNIIKAHLWTFGHSVKDVSEIPGANYDLLVNGKIRLKVFMADPTESGHAYAPDCDAIAFVYGTKRRPQKRYALNGGDEFSPTPRAVLNNSRTE